MNVDETALIFVVEYYEMLTSNREMLGNAYAEGARIVLYNKQKPISQCCSNFHKFIPAGVRKILQCSGTQIGDKLYVQVKSTLVQPAVLDYLDECFVCNLTESNMLIIYHSVHVNPIVEPLPILPPPPVVAKKQVPKQEPPPPPKIEPTVEVNSPADLDPKKSALFQNLSFEAPPSDFVPVLEKYGHVVKFSQIKGKLVCEFALRETVNNLIHLPQQIEWHKRAVRIIRMPFNFEWR